MKTFAARLGSAALATLLLLLVNDHRADAGPVSWGETISHVGVGGHAAWLIGRSQDIGYKYSYFAILGLDLWCWGGTYCVYGKSEDVSSHGWQTKYVPISPAQVAQLLGKAEHELQTPFCYRFPLGLLIFPSLVVIIGVTGGLICGLRVRRDVARLVSKGYSRADAEKEVLRSYETPPTPPPKADPYERMLDAAREAAASPRDADVSAEGRRIHWRIIILGFVIGILGAALLPVVELTRGPNRPQEEWYGTAKLAVFFGFASYFAGIATGCLIAPASFYAAPVGQRWLKLVGTKSVARARLVCLVLILLVVGMATFVGLAAYMRWFS